MENSTELRKVVYNVLLTQIQFGTYRYGEKLPNIEETSSLLCVSVDTARAAYLKLRDGGYITLSKKVGATVSVKLSAQETEQFVQTFFSMRKHAIFDLAASMFPLFGNVQWNGLKNASSETLQAMDRLSREVSTSAPYAILTHINQKYSALGNALLMRLVWQSSMFLHVPIFSFTDNLQYFEPSADYLPAVMTLCRNKDWPSLRAEVERTMKRLSFALNRFYETRITAPPAEEEITFAWSSYRKNQQLCYSFAMELLLSISQGRYPVGSLLPTQKELAVRKGISVSTVRRAFELLDSVGAIKSAKYVGTKILPFDKTTENSDFTNPVLRRRLLDMTESLQILALSCREVSLLTLSSLDGASVRQLLRELDSNRKRQRGETLSYFILKSIAELAPLQTIRTVYSELLLQFFWAYALRGMEGSQEYINRIYAPYFDALAEALQKADYSRFSAALEELIIYELRSTVNYLSQLDFPGMENILIPDENRN